MRIYRIIGPLLSAIAVLIAPVCAAQTTESTETESTPKEAGPGIHVRGLSFQLPAQLPELYMHDPAGGDEAVGVKLTVKDYLNRDSGTIPLKGKSIIFTKKPEHQSIKSPADVVASLTIPGNPSSLICMFVPGTGAAGAPPCRVYPIEDDKKGFPKGSLKILNLSPLPVRIQLEKKNFDFKVGEIKVISDPPVGPSNSSGMVAYRFENGQWQKIASGIWPNPGTVRVLQILFKSPSSGQIELMGIRDIAVPN
ncbi:hypothetical protein JIN85_01560 [Luteolibacter pohnpeiensis]|uniref:Uncharacterized protein n=1 Tax=Luteolibacter pohnpeiensis TaxID=454153 RepID=A0A934S824_9BACT|nr:hypothetical protein [Luteolibacter pohnpeiensis]MBK1881079.1 hypothetical protein [Luteolibacter pohnpeiensis]